MGDTDPVSLNLSESYSHSASDVDVAAARLTIISGNGGSYASNLPSLNNSEEGLPLEPQPAPVPAQVSGNYTCMHSEVTCICMNPCSYVASCMHACICKT